MVKKRKSKAKKSSGIRAKKPAVEHESPKMSSEFQIEKMLVQNFISLQKVMTNLSMRFEDLSSQISKLLGLFEISAKALAEKDFDINAGNSESNKEIVSKIDNLLEQNKIIARGLTLMHRAIPNSQPQTPNIPEPQMSVPQPSSIAPQNSAIDMGEYQRSISSAKESDSLESSVGLESNRFHPRKKIE